MKLNLATFEDMLFLFDLRNHPEVRRQSANQEIISLETHKAWYKDSLIKVDRYIYIFGSEEVSVGMGRADKNDDAYELSWAIHPDFQGKGFGKSLVNSLINKHSPCLARIRKDNSASLHIAKKCGLKIHKSDDKFVYLKSIDS